MSVDLNQAEVLGIFWYRNARDYEAFLKLFIDVDVLPASYSAWLRQAEQGRTHLLRQGHVTVKVEASPEAFIDYINANGQQPNAAGRMAFANAKALEYAIKLRAAGRTP